MFSFLKKPASEGLIAAASSMVCVCFEQLINRNDAAAMAGLATAQIFRHAHSLEIPTSVKDRFTECVWTAAVAYRPQLQDRFVLFALSSVTAIKMTERSPFREDLIEAFWKDYFSDRAEEQSETAYYSFATNLLEAADSFVWEKTTKWRRKS